MALTFDDLKDLDAREQRDRPVLPKGKYKVELGSIAAKEMESKKGDTFIQVSCALTPLGSDVHVDDLEAAAEEWGGTVDEMLEQAQIWFRKPLYEAQNLKDLHNMLVRATGEESLPGDMKALSKATKGLIAYALVDVEVYDGTRRNSDVRRFVSE